eukprot:g3256.t1
MALRFEDNGSSSLPHVRAAVAASAQLTTEQWAKLRRERIEYWRGWSERLPHDPATPFHVRVVDEMDRHYDFLGRGPGRPRLSVCQMVVEGATMHGVLEDPELFARDPDAPKAPKKTADHVLRLQGDVLRDILVRMEGETPANVATILEKSDEDVRQGFAEWIEPDKLPANVVYYHRFIAQQIKHDAPTASAHPADWVRKERAVDDGTQNFANDAATVATPITVNTLDRMAATCANFATTHAQHLGPAGVANWSGDHRCACRTVRASNRTFTRVVVVQDPRVRSATLRRRLRFLLMRRLMFGEAASVLQYNRVARLICVVVCVVMLFGLDHFYDDLQCPVRGNDSRAHADLLSFVRDVLRVSFADKFQCGPTIIYTGVVVKFTPQQLLFSLSGPRAQKLRHYAREALRRDFLLPATAKRLAGKFSWACCALFGRIGRAMLKPILRRADSKQKFCRLSRSLRLALEWWVKFLESADGMQRSYPIRGGDKPRQPHLVYSDACEYGLGAVLLLPWSRTAYYFRVPVRDEDPDIAELELEAGALGHCVFGEFLRGAEVVQFIDNNVALGWTTAGKSHRPEADAVLHDLWMWLARNSEFVWFERVASKGNLADKPSRMLSPAPDLPGWRVYELQNVGRYSALHSSRSRVAFRLEQDHEVRASSSAQERPTTE